MLESHIKESFINKCMGKLEYIHAEVYSKNVPYTVHKNILKVDQGLRPYGALA